MSIRYHLLLLKQHKVTGLKYLCYHYGTLESCFTYRGSGVYWSRHLKKHGNKINTVVLEKSEDKNSVKEKGIYYSKLWNIVDSKEFANLIVEDCATTFSHINHTDLHKKVSEQTRMRQLGKTMSERLGREYVSPAKGKPAIEIRGASYQVWNKGKNMKKLKGSDYVDPKSKPFQVSINQAETITCNSEQDFFSKVGLNSPTLCKLKRAGVHVIKRQRNSKHRFSTGDQLKFCWVG